MRTGPIRGSLTWIRHQRWQVDRVEHDPPVTRLDVVGPNGSHAFLMPFDQPVTASDPGRPIRVRRARARAELQSLWAQSFSIDTLVAARHASLRLYPHQLEPVLAVLDGHRRVLITDAVGLGKTVQAGLILAEMRRRSPSLRALLIVPAGLIDQWTTELATRFGLAVRAADDIDHSGVVYGQHPWQMPGVWIGSADYLKQAHVFSRLPTDPWDVVIVDEAHLATGLSDRHRAVHALCQRARHVVLMTATPHSGDATSFRRLIGLGALPAMRDPPLMFRRTRQTIALDTRRHVRWHRVGVGPDMRSVLTELEAYERVVARGTDARGQRHGALLVSVFRRRAASTLGAFARTVARRLEWLGDQGASTTPDWMQPNLFLEDGEDLVGADERAALILDTGVPAERERRALDRLYRRVVRALPGDAKLRRLSCLLARVPEPAVVFTEFRHSLEAVAAVVAPRRTVAVLHGGLSPGDRHEALDAFLSGRADVLVATDVAGLGLNLHTRSRWVINLDIPWNPSRLEQRIGRVDRIGQARPVHATVLMLDHPGDRNMRRALTERVDAARQAVDPSLFDTMTIDGRDAATVPPLAPTTRWARAGRAHARLLETSRSRARRWRGPRVVRHRPIAWAPNSGLHSRPEARTWLGFRVSLIDRTGSSLEEHLVVASVPARLDPSRLPPAALAQAEQVVTRRLAARVRRVSRLLASRRRRRQSSDQAVEAHVETLTRATDTQLGLFTRTFRSEVACAPVVDESVVGHPTADQDDDAARVVIGRPLLQWMWVV